MILGINILMALPKSAIIINRITIQVYGFSKLKILGLDGLIGKDVVPELSILTLFILQRSIFPD
jgi:hypothetical protein